MDLGAKTLFVYVKLRHLGDSHGLAVEDTRRNRLQAELPNDDIHNYLLIGALEGRPTFFRRTSFILFRPHRRSAPSIDECVQLFYETVDILLLNMWHDVNRKEIDGTLAPA